MADMDFQLVLEAIVKGQDALDKLAKSEEQIAKAAKAANESQAASAGKADAAMKREAEAMQRAATAAKSLGTGAHAAAGASTQQAAAAERVATAEKRAADATKAHATAATMEAKAVQTAARAQSGAAVAAAGARGRDARGRFLPGGGRGEFLREAASQATPYGYLLGAGAAAAGGAAIGIGAYAAYETSKRLATASVGEAMSREVAFAQVQKKVNLEAGQSWEQLDRQIAKVSTTLGKSYQDTAAIFDQGGAAGIAGRDLETFGLLAAKVATAWDVDARSAAQMLTEVRAQTGKTIPDLEKFADKVNYLGDISAAAERDIGAMYQRAAAGMAAAGVGEDQSLAMMTALRGVGMQDEVASRFLTFFSGRLRTATSWKDGPLEALKAIGMTAKEVEMGMQTKPMETILTFLDKASHAKNVVGTMKDILGGEWFDEGLRFAQAAPEIIRLLDALSKGNYNNSMQSALDIELGTTEAKINRLKASLTDLMATWAKPWAKGVLEPIVEAATKKIDELRAAEERSQASKAGVKPKGLSVADYEAALGLNREPPAVIKQTPTMALSEGNTPHLARTKGFGKDMLDASQFAQAAEKVTNASNSAFDALQKLNGTTATVNVDASGAIASAAAAQKAIDSLTQSIRTLNSLGAPGAVRTPALQPGPEHSRLEKHGRINLPATGVIASRGGLRPAHVANGGHTIHYAPRVQVAGGGDVAAEIRKYLREHPHELAAILRRESDAKSRLSYRDTA
ncbi:phage tail tape measure protein [Methylocystis sp. S23]